MSNEKTDFESMLKGSDELISPEGVEEKVIHKEEYIITLTGGGKYRLYTESTGNKRQDLGVVDELGKAKENLGQVMMVAAGLILDPEGTIKAIIGGMKNRDRPTTKP